MSRENGAYEQRVSFRLLHECFLPEWKRCHHTGIGLCTKALHAESAFARNGQIEREGVAPLCREIRPRRHVNTALPSTVHDHSDRLLGAHWEMGGKYPQGKQEDCERYECAISPKKSFHRQMEWLLRCYFKLVLDEFVIVPPKGH